MDSISGHDFLPSYFLMPLIISTRCCKVNLFFPTADAVLAVGFDPKTGISEGLMLFSILSGGGGKKFCDLPHVSPGRRSEVRLRREVRLTKVRLRRERL